MVNSGARATLELVQRVRGVPGNGNSQLTPRLPPRALGADAALPVERVWIWHSNGKPIEVQEWGGDARTIRSRPAS